LYNRVVIRVDCFDDGFVRQGLSGTLLALLRVTRSAKSSASSPGSLAFPLLPSVRDSSGLIRCNNGAACSSDGGSVQFAPCTNWQSSITDGGRLNRFSNGSTAIKRRALTRVSDNVLYHRGGTDALLSQEFPRDSLETHATVEQSGSNFTEQRV
jgi:hypothetical protein